tara:strand:- start:9615 stop:10844 length:1230 start_codon:yes stop_codon:yes gene_type:complete
MTINAKHVTPGQAIAYSHIMFEGNLALRMEEPSVNLLSMYLEGEPGVGKSAIAKRLAKMLNYYFVDIRANQMSPDDAGGIRMPNVETQTTDWFAPYWLPSEDGKVRDTAGNELKNEDGKPYDGTVLFFDELASADDRVRKPLFGAFLDRELNGREIPDNCLIMAAGNESETGTMVFELDNATRTRFITLRIVADFTSWMTDYAPGANITPTVVAFLKNNTGNFCMTEKALQNKMDLYGNPRSWEHVSIAERSIMRKKEDYSDPVKRDALEAQIAGKIGIELANEFMAVFDIIAKMTTLYDLLEAAKKDKSKLKQLWPKELSQLYALAYSMMSYPKDVATGKEITALMAEFPEKDELPFQEMKPAIVEVMLKRLKESGVSDKDINKNFGKEANEVSDSAMEGPLIKIDLG